MAEKRRHDGGNSNYNAAGPSSSTRGILPNLMDEPNLKRGRMNEPEPEPPHIGGLNVEKNLVLDRENDEDFRDERILGRHREMDERIIELRRMEKRFQMGSIDRNLSDDLDQRRMDNRRIDLAHIEGHVNRGHMDDFERRRVINDSFERGRLDQRSSERMDDLRMGGIRSDELRLGGVRCDELRMGGIRTDELRMGGVRSDHLRMGGVRSDDLRMGDIRSNDFSNNTDVRRFAVSDDFGRDEHSIGVGRMRHTPETSYDQREIEFDRLNDISDRSDDRSSRDFDDLERPIRDNLLGGIDSDFDLNRPVSMLNSLIENRRNYRRESIERDNRDSFSNKATNFQDDLYNRNYGRLLDVSQEFQRKTPDRNIGRPIGRVDVNSDRFLEQSREDDAFGSTNIFGSRRDNFFESPQSSRFNSGGRNDFLDDINEPAPSGWNTFAGGSRDAYIQDRREFGGDMESLRRNVDIDTDRLRNSNFTKTVTNEYESHFPNRNRRFDFERRNVNDRFNRFN